MATNDIKIIVDESLYHTPEVQKLVNTRGYLVCPQQFDWDMYIGPKCHFITPETIKHLAVALKGARARKKADKKGNK